MYKIDSSGMQQCVKHVDVRARLLPVVCTIPLVKVLN